MMLRVRNEQAEKKRAVRITQGRQGSAPRIPSATSSPERDTRVHPACVLEPVRPIPRWDPDEDRSAEEVAF